MRYQYKSPSRKLSTFPRCGNPSGKLTTLAYMPLGCEHLKASGLPKELLKPTANTATLNKEREGLRCVALQNVAWWSVNMSLEFFSQFLLVEEIVTQEQLESARVKLDVSNHTLGSLAVAAGYMTETQASDLNREQLQRDIAFGLLAVEQGLLSENQLENLLTRQSQQHMQLGQVLVELEILDDLKVRDALAQFAEVQSPKSEQLFQAIDSLSDSAAARYLVDSFPRMTMRLSQIHVKVTPGQQAPLQAPNDYTASITLKGPGGVCVSLSSDKQFARKMMDGMTRMMAGDSNVGYGDNKDDFEDLLGGFLDIIAGQAVGVLEKSSVRLEMGTPTFGLPPEGGYAFELQTTNGNATLILAAAA